MNLILPDPLQRWRLLLGEASENSLGSAGQLNGDLAHADAALEWLYGQDPERISRSERSGGRGGSQLSVPDWINSIHTLFPREVIERLERDAVEKYGIDEVVTNLDVLARIEPSESLLRAVLHTKHLMNADVLAAARKLVEEVVRCIMERLQTQVHQAFGGTRHRRHRSHIKMVQNFDFQKTITTHLHRWHPQKKRLYLDKPIFMSRVHRQVTPWDLILLVDQSGSMVSSVIHSAVMAACLWQLPGMRTRLVAFDTELVDLTDDIADPVEFLMKVQLSGGTDIAKAVGYAQHCMTYPKKTIIILVSDFFEGGSSSELVSRVKNLVESGAKVLGLAALDENAHPAYDRAIAARLVNVGAQIGAMTPGQLAVWLAEKIQS